MSKILPGKYIHKTNDKMPIIDVQSVNERNGKVFDTDGHEYSLTKVMKEYMPLGNQYGSDEFQLAQYADTGGPNHNSMLGDLKSANEKAAAVNAGDSVQEQAIEESPSAPMVTVQPKTVLRERHDLSEEQMLVYSALKVSRKKNQKGTISLGGRDFDFDFDIHNILNVANTFDVDEDELTAVLLQDKNVADTLKSILKAIIATSKK